MLILSAGHNNHVELLGGLRGMDPAIFWRTEEVQFRGVNLRFVGREDLIAKKCFEGEPRDLVDAQSAYRSRTERRRHGTPRWPSRGCAHLEKEKAFKFFCSMKGLKRKLPMHPDYIS